MKVSVVITVFNEEKVIGECLKSLSNQTLTDFEVIAVDDGSSDDTWKVLSEIRNLKFGIRKFRAKHRGAGAGRNYGAKQAKGEILVFVDADMTFEKNFLKMLVKPIVSGRSKGTFSKYEYVSNWNNVWARCWNINQNWLPKRRHPKNYPDTQFVFRAILKSEFDKVGGFTPGGYDDDWSLGQKLGYEAVSAPNAIFYHKNPDNLKEVFNHAKWVGKRKYKFGLLGCLITLFKVSLPISLSIGLYKSVLNRQFAFLIFKIVYDFGVFVGILEHIFFKKVS